MTRHAIRTAALLAIIGCLCAPGTPQGTVLRAPVRVARTTPGRVSEDGLVTFEDVAVLSPRMRSAVKKLRSGAYAAAIAEFRSLQLAEPANPLAYRGEIQAAVRVDTDAEHFATWGELNRASERPGPAIAATVKRFSGLLARSSADPGRRAVLEYAVGDALIAARENRAWVAAPRPDLGPEPELHLKAALRLHPKMLVAHLALATYYDYQSGPNGYRGVLARRQYDDATALRPELACKLRYLHALTWVRPGYVTPRELARLRGQGLRVPDDWRMLPAKTIAECKELVRDYPDYLPAYERISELYEYPLGNKALAAKFRKMAEAVRAKRQAKE